MKNVTMTPTMTRRNEQAPAKYRNLHLKVMRGEVSPRQAIKVMCLECVGWERREVTACTSSACPLHRLRPFQPAGRNDAEGAEVAG